MPASFVAFDLLALGSTNFVERPFRERRAALETALASARPPIFLTQTAAAGGIALINSVGNLGGFLGPSIVGWALETTKSSAAGLMVITACLIVSVLAVVLVGWRVRMPASATTDASP